jgi:hypothetical protein
MQVDQHATLEPHAEENWEAPPILSNRVCIGFARGCPENMGDAVNLLSRFQLTKVLARCDADMDEANETLVSSLRKLFLGKILSQAFTLGEVTP